MPFFDLKSLSTRREWIEIADFFVDDTQVISLSPHGESGLKSSAHFGVSKKGEVSLHTERVD